jgi:hypothetical protein
VKRFVALAGLGTVVAWLAFPGSPALACTCDVLPVRAQIEGADAVFSGQVLSVAHSGTEQNVSMRVGQVYKGSPGETVSVSTASSPDACGIQFATEARYVVFARTASGGYTTSLCAGTTDDLTALDRAGFTGHPPASPIAFATSQAATALPKPQPRALPIALASIMLGAVFAVHARRFARS